MKTAMKFVLVMQPETKQMWAEKGWAGRLTATSPAQGFKPKGLSE